MKYKVHRLDVRMTRDQGKLEQFLDNLKVGVIAIMNRLTTGQTSG